MGVMLTIDQRRGTDQLRPGPGAHGQPSGPWPRRARRRRGQHERTREEQACLDAFAAFLRSDAPGAGRSLSRLATGVLSSQLLPAARALADAVDGVLADTVGEA